MGNNDAINKTAEKPPALAKENEFFIELIRRDFALPDRAAERTADFDWSYLFDTANENRLFPIFYDAVKDILPSEQKKVYFVFNHKHKQQIKTFAEEIGRIHRGSEAEKIRFLLVKGLAFAEAIYGDIFKRQAGDIDILVEEEDAVRMDYLLRNLGYAQPYNAMSEWETEGMKSLPYPLKRMRQANHLFEYHKQDNPGICVKLHKNLHSLRSFTPEVMWSNRQIKINGSEIRTLDLSHMFIFMLLNTRVNSDGAFALQNSRLLRDYVDIRFFMRKYSAEINREEVRALLEKYEVIKNVRSVLLHYFELYGTDSDVSDIFTLLYGEPPVVNTTNALKMDFVESTLSPRERRVMAQQFIKRRIFNPRKFEDCLDVYPEVSGVGDLSGYEIYSTNLGLSFRYKITYDADGLFFRLILDERLSFDLDKLLIHIKIANNDPENSTLQTVFELTSKDGEYVFSYYSTPIIRNTNVLRQTQKITIAECETENISGTEVIRLRMPYEAITADPRSGDEMIAYKLLLQKFVFDGVYHDFTEDNGSIYKAKVLRIC